MHEDPMQTLEASTCHLKNTHKLACITSRNRIVAICLMDCITEWTIYTVTFHMLCT